MISLPSGARVWLACGRTDMRKADSGIRYNRIYDTLGVVYPVCRVLLGGLRQGAPYGRSGNAGAAGAGGGSIRWRMVCLPRPWRRTGEAAVVRWAGHVPVQQAAGEGTFIWPVTETGRVSLTPAQLSMLLDHPC
jgi:hypothetical protein